MATYISLIQYTQQGLAAVKESPKRLDAARKTFEQAGVKIKEFYLVMGKYDIVIIAEAPNDDVALRNALEYGLAGNGRSRTMRAFTSDEAVRVTKQLS